MAVLQETGTSAESPRANAVPVLVVGAGPTGLAAAIGLKSAGVHVRVIDAAQGPAETSRALGLQPRGVEVLNRLGALGDLIQRSVNLRGTVIRINGQERFRLALPADNVSDGPPVLVISQAESEAEMRGVGSEPDFAKFGL
jgi:4,5-epoxidase